MQKFIQTILASSLLIFAGTGLAQNDDTTPRHSGQGKFGPGGQRGMQGMPVIEHFTRAMRQLDLSDEQEESIRAVMQRLKTDVRPVMGDMKASQMQLKELIKADDYDENAVAELAAKEGDLAAERIILSSKAFAQMYGYLSDEQRVQLDEMAATRMHRRGEKRRHRGGEG